jgi:uncharacterized membrane protein
MKSPSLTSEKPLAGSGSKSKFEMETLVGYLLMIGVLLSMLLTVAGLVWHWLSANNLQLNYTLSGINLLKLTGEQFYLLFAGAIGPKILINIGIIVLLLTPFAAVERNLKYTIFTAFVFAVLTYSLFIH